MKPDFEKMNGLVPAVVQDFKTKQVLMLAYVNEKAYEKRDIYVFKQEFPLFLSWSQRKTG